MIASKTAQFYSTLPDEDITCVLKQLNVHNNCETRFVSATSESSKMCPA